LVDTLASISQSARKRRLTLVFEQIAGLFTSRTFVQMRRYSSIHRPPHSV